MIVASGTYNLGATSLSNSQTGVNVHGAAGQPRPVITTSADTGLALFGAGARVADLTINQSGGLYGLNVFASGVLVQRVEVHTSAPIACTAGISGLARDLLCVTTAASGVALDDSWGSGTFALTLRNVTAIATGAGSYGIRADASGNDTNLDISARNVIASGVTADIRSTEVGTNSESDVLLSNSNYDKIEEGGGGNVSNVGSVSSNQTALPIFARRHPLPPGAELPHGRQGCDRRQRRDQRTSTAIPGGWVRRQTSALTSTTPLRRTSRSCTCPSRSRASTR